MTSLLAIGLTVISTLIGAAGAFYFKKGANKLKFTIKSIMHDYILIAAVVLYGLASAFFIYALSLKGSELSILYPLISLSYVWVAIISMKFLKEKMNTHKWIGMGLIILGVIFIGLGS